MNYLESLNERQKEAVLDRDHNLLILACAGSGKTRVITSKIAYYIESGFLKPYEILAVTFTNKAAAEMRDRLAVMLPDVDISRLEIRTFHSFGSSVLRRFSDKADLKNNFSIYDDGDSTALLSQIFPELDKKDARSIYSYISKAKDLGILPNTTRAEHFARDIDDFPLYFDRYERALRGTGNCDFADLILRPVILLNRYEDARSVYQRRFKQILVDEYQDSNKMQFELLSLISGPNSQLCVVGDDDQSIYSFRGADIENILTFNKSFKNVKQIKLEKNYRSTSEILSLAAAVIKNNKARHKKEIVSFDGHHGKKPELIYSFDGKEEAETIIRKIRRINDYDNTAIIYRTNAQSLEFERLLGLSRIPYRLVGALKFYEREEIKDTLAILRLLVNPLDSVNFRRIINKPSRGLGDKTIDKILVGDDTDTIKALREASSSFSAKAKEGAQTFLNAYDEASFNLDNNMPLEEVVKIAFSSFGLQSYYEAEKDESIRTSKNENLNAFLSTLSDYPAGRRSLEEFLENITLDNSTAGGKGEDDRPGVTLITMHNTKGLEFDYVFVSGLEDELIPGARSSQTEKGVEEERRLFYVAVTRAKKELYLSYAASRYMWGRRDYRKISRYLEEIPEDMMLSSGVKEIDNPNPYIGSRVTYRTSSDFTNKPSWAKNIDIKPRKAEKREIPLYSLYDIVLSPTYGRGMIIDIKSGEIGKRLLTIKFDIGTVRLNEATASLSIVGKGEKISEGIKSTHFNVDDKVKSPAYGTGVITEIKEVNSKRVLTVLFDSGKTIKLMEGYSKLEKI